MNRHHFFQTGTQEEKYLTEREEWEKPSFCPFVCSNHSIISTIEIGPVPLYLKRMCASLIECNMKNNVFMLSLPHRHLGH